MRRSDWLWIGALALLMLAGSGLVPMRPSETVESSSFSVSAGGKKAFFALSRILLEEVTWSLEHLTPPEDGDTLVILGPARYPDRAEWQRLYRWVVEGHSLVFAARWNNPVVDMEPFSVQIETDGLQTDGLETSLVGGDIEWRSAGKVVTDSVEAEVMAARGDTVQIMRQRVGKGALVVAGSDYIFSNFSLANSDNGLLAFRILELAAPRGPIYFDEWLNGSGEPKVVGLLFDDPLRPLTLQILICAVVLVWQGSKRFGPTIVTREAQRRSLSEHAVALGNLHYKVGSGSRIVRSYLEYFRYEVGLYYRRYRKSEEAKVLAQRAGLDADWVGHLLNRARRATRNPKLEPSNAARLVQSLAALKTKTERLKGDVHGA